MQIERVVTILSILENWLEDNIHCESEIIFDNDENNTNSEVLYPAVVKAQAILEKLSLLSSQSVNACVQRLQLAVDSKGPMSPDDVAALLLATRHLMLSPEAGE
ncbi:hypothetical protein ABWC92_004595 [Escherichia coli]